MRSLAVGLALALLPLGPLTTPPKASALIASEEAIDLEIEAEDDQDLPEQGQADDSATEPEPVPTDTTQDAQLLDEDGEEQPELGSAGETTLAPKGSFSAVLPLATGSTRASGSDRYGTAVALSERLFPQAGGAQTVFIASGNSFADGLALSALASYVGGPLLLTATSSVPPAVVAEIRRLSPQEIVVAGGEGAVSDAAFAKLEGLAPQVRRVSGPDRYATAAAIAAEFPQGSGAMLATGVTFPDALVASAASHKNGGGGPVLLTRGFTASPEALEALRELKPSEVTIVGGTWSSSSLEKIRQASGTKPDVRKGADRYATSAAVAQKFWPAKSSTVIYATGATYPDAMAAGPVARAYDAPVLLMTRACRPKAILTQASAQSKVLIVGGSGAIATGATSKTCPVLPAVVSQSSGYYRFSMTHRAQETNYYCGPATAQMILSRLGYNHSKSGLALTQYNLGRSEFLKTNVDGRTRFRDSRMSVGMNAWTGKTLYAQMWTPTTSQFRAKVSASFTSTGRPVVVDTQEWSGGAHYNGHPAYSTFSHLLPVEGYNPSTDTLIMLDSASHFYSASQKSFTHSLSGFTQFLQQFGIYY